MVHMPPSGRQIVTQYLTKQRNSEVMALSSAGQVPLNADAVWGPSGASCRGPASMGVSDNDCSIHS